MHLNAFRQMDDRERRGDVAYAIVLTSLLVVIPIIVGTAATIMGHKFVGLALAFASIGFGFVLGLNVRRLIIARFFRVTDVTPWVELEEVDGHLLSQLMSTSMLSFANMCDLPGITFAYNWLLKHQAIPARTTVKFYNLTGSRLVSFLECDAEADLDILLIPLDELSLSADNEARFWHEFSLLGGLKFEDLVARIRKETSDGTREETYANKGQKL